MAWALASLAPALVACHGQTSSDATSGDRLLDRPPSGSVTLTTTSVPGLGRILTDGQGRVLYLFPPDARERVRCSGPCAGTWPALAVTEAAAVRAQGRARSRLVGTLPDPNTGARVVTYRGNPLYLYAGDVRPHQVNGQGLFLDGGPWYVLNPAGLPVTGEPSRTGSRR